MSYRLKLIKGKSYWGAGVKASQENPFVNVETKEHADRLVKTGHFILDDIVENGNAQVEKTSSDTGEELTFPDENTEEKEDASENSILAELHTKKKDELVQYAADCGIDISGCKTKDDIISKIVEAMARAAVTREAIRGEV